eukprot:m.989815 g.989815  ORF g.989815 m.989815 type:complete len:717 (-) comp23997_c0_seq1:1952-4102(-)
MASIPAFAVLLLNVALSSGTDFHYKMLSGGPEEFAQHRIPNPVNTAVVGDHTALVVNFTAVRWSHVIDVDSTAGFSFAVFTTVKDAAVFLTDPTGNNIDLKDVESNFTVPIADSGLQVPGRQWNFVNPTAGTYVVSLVVSSLEQDVLRHRQQADCDGYVLVWSDSQDSLFTHTINLHTVVGADIGLSARMFDKTKTPFSEFLQTKVKPTVSVLPDRILSAKMAAVYPNGHKIAVPMKDDGTGADETANDGDYAGTISATQAGVYTLQASLTGKSGMGFFTRTQEHTITVNDAVLTFYGTAVGYVDHSSPEAPRLKLSVLVDTPDVSEAATSLLKPYAELWGFDASGTQVPVAYTECLARINRLFGIKYMDLEVDLRWLHNANISLSRGPLSLQNVYVQNADSLVPLAVANDVTVNVLGNPLTAKSNLTQVVKGPSCRRSEQALDAALKDLTVSGYDGSITPIMREGVPPRGRAGAGAYVNKSAAELVNGKVVLVHGFCADKNPFEVQAEDWTDAVYYSAAREGNPLSRSNNEFAQDVLRFVEKEGLGSFSAVGQSQGGMVILHILNYYHTGLDETTTGRKIQSIATPYLGSSALSSLKGIADLLAPDCKGPTDLTREGAVMWMTGISQANIEQTNVYRTQYKPGGLFGIGSCNELMNLVLQLPNDGVTEIVFSAPETGGNVVEPKIGYCHTADMNWDPSYWDKDRNNEMNSNAARS